MPTETPTAPPALIELEGVVAASLEEPDRPKVQGVNWAIREGEWWVIGALPGGGKSGLLATAAGMIRPLEGRQRLWGRDVAEQSGDDLAVERRRIGFVFSDGGRVFRQLTVAQNVALPYCYHQDCPMEEVADEVVEFLDLLGLTFVAQVPGSRLSPSWRVRTALARALILRPEVLFLDNPLLGLDRKHQYWWLDFLAALHAGHPWLGGKPLALVVATYDVVPWLKNGRRFALLKDNQWSPLGAYEAAAGFDDPLWRELLAESTPAH